MPDILPTSSVVALTPNSDADADADTDTDRNKNTSMNMACVAVGDALCGSAVVVLGNDGIARCLRRPTITITCSTPPLPTSTPRTEENIEAHIQRIYADVLKQPTPSPALRNSAQGIDLSALATPAGTNALANAISSLRSSYVEYAHRASHDLEERLEELKSEVQAQEVRAEKVEALSREVDRRRAVVDAALRRAVWMSENLARRIQLLAELHWALPRPASAAELAFKKRELPEMESVVRGVATEVGGFQHRIAILLSQQQQQQQQHEEGGYASSLALASATVPPAQLRQVREALASHDGRIRAAQQQAKELERALKSVVV